MTQARRESEHHAGDRFGSSFGVAAQAIIGSARDLLVDQTLSDAETVHGLRRAFKRWRALLRLLARPIGEPAERMRTEARDLMRTLSGSRDAQAALDALADLGQSGTPLSPTSMKTIEGRLTKLRNEAEAANFTAEIRARVGRYLDVATLSVQAWPLAELEFDTIADGLTKTYRQARALVPEDWNEADGKELHELRKRVVEHRHQMDLIEALWPRLAKVWAQEAQRLRERLGACQDLTVFEGLMGPHRPLAPWRSRLAPLIAERRAAHLDASAKLAGRLFAEKPKAFHVRIGALWKARQLTD